jgi:hypothetical protein
MDSLIHHQKRNGENCPKNKKKSIKYGILPITKYHEIISCNNAILIS